MIHGLDTLLVRLAAYVPCAESAMPLAEKIDALDAAITAAVGRACAAYDSGEPVHLAYSGGIDSSVVLYKMARAGAQVVAHTMVASARHPDLVSARSVVTTLQTEGYDVAHRVHCVSPTSQDIESSNRLLGRDSSRPDSYYMLMKVLAPHTSRLVSCDCIDELLGGYHSHRDPRRYFAHFDNGADQPTNRLAALRHHLARLKPEHIEPLQECSELFGITVHEPYGDADVMEATAMFAVSEMVGAEDRKKPVYEVGRRLGVPSGVLTRRKYGLVDAFRGGFA